MNPEQTLHALRAARVIAVLRAASARDALAVAHVLLDAGITAIEVTFTTPNATRVLAELAHDDRVLLGAGTITAPTQVDEAARAGARFLVSPGSRPHVLRAMRDTGLAALPGALTATELMHALDLGAHAIKLFPASAVAPNYLTQLQGPFPHARVVPTGGLSPDTASRWLAAGAWAVGLGGALAPARLQDTTGREQLMGTARALVSTIRHDP